MMDTDTGSDDSSRAHLPCDHSTLLIVDDEVQVTRSLERMLRQSPFKVLTANSARDGLILLRSHPVGVVMSDQMMPEMDGVTFLEQVKAYDPDIVRLLLTAYASLKNALEAINRSQIFEYLTKPWTEAAVKSAIGRAFAHFHLIKENRRLLTVTQDQNTQLRDFNQRLEMRVRQRTSELEQAVREGVHMLAVAAEAKDDDTGAHVYRIQNMVNEICLQMGLPSEQAEAFGFFSIMHDVGKIHVPDRILQKPGPLTEKERLIMQTHTIVGERILGDKPFYTVARQIARSHHERMDGNGYPDRLKGSAIPLPARIVAVADVFDALTHQRPYKPAWPKADAVDEISRQAGPWFDVDVVNAFLQVVNNPQELLTEYDSGPEATAYATTGR